MNEGRSRRSKLDGIPSDHLMQLVRRALLFTSLYGNHVHPSGVTAAVERAAESGNEEALWLQRVLLQQSSKPKDWYDPWDWIAETLKSENTKWGRFYRGVALWMTQDDVAGLAVLVPLAKEGFAPAMSAIGSALEHSSSDESRAWLQKAAELNDADGLAMWADLLQAANPEEKWPLYARAAELGSLKGLISMAALTTDKRQRTILWARQTLMSGESFSGAVELVESLRKLVEGHVLDALDIELLYVAGRELEGFEQIWGEDGLNIRSDDKACINVYLTVMSRARQAALQTIAGMREVGLLHDLAVMIARHVYRTRDLDPFAWYNRTGG